MGFNIGDVVQVGKGKAEWTVTNGDELTTWVTSSKGQKKVVHPDTLTLIREAVSAPVKNDHRESAYGRMILAGLQLKAHVFQGLKRPNKRQKNRSKKG